MVFNYLDNDVKVTGSNTESNYLTAELLVPGTNWSKTSNINASANTLTFYYPFGITNINGEYTAGVDAAIPNIVPQFISNNSGNWNDKTIWSVTNGSTFPCPDGGPNGFIVTINQGNVVHNFGTIEGTGTMYLESGGLPAGKYASFFDCGNGGTLEFGGTGLNYTLIGGYLFQTVPKLFFTGTGTRVLPNNDIIICTQLKIDGPTLDNSIYNKKLTVQGTMELYNTGVFNSGTGIGASVTFAGLSAQTIGGTFGNFSGTNAFNNLEINNSNGLTLNGPTELKGNLLLTDGNITTTSANSLTVSNILNNCVTPAGGSLTSYVSGPLTKTIVQGDNFVFPVGKGINIGNLLTLSATQSGTQNWTVEYFNPNLFTGLLMPLTAINMKEYWNVSSVSGNKAIVNIKWSASSDLSPIMTQNGILDMKIAQYDGINNYWTQLASSASGDNNSGSAQTSSLISMPANGNYNFTLGCLNQVKPTVKFAPAGPVCGANFIPITLSSGIPNFSPYSISYTKGGIAQTPLTPTSFPTNIPTDVSGGVYQITGFTYNYPAGTIHSGVFDPTVVTSFAVPTTAIAGPDQSICGGTSTTLAGNSPSSGTGQWSILSGAGGTIVTPTNPASIFKGTNGSTYTLRWTISNGTCISTDDAVIIFPLLAVQPSNFTVSSANVCLGASGVVYTVPNDPTASAYNWTYSGTGANITGITNSVLIDFSNTATSGTLSVTSTNSCNTSIPRTISITLNQNIWLGTSSSNWGSPSNWQAGILPPSGADLSFVASPVNNLVLDVNRTIGNLLINGNSQLVIQPATCLTVNGSITTLNNDQIYIQSSPTLANGSLISPNATNVKATVEMYSKAYCTNPGTKTGYTWQYFGIPVTSVIASPTFDGSYVRLYNEAITVPNGKWTSLTNSSQLSSFIGYEITQTNPTIIIFKGVLETGSKTIPLTNTTGAYDPGQNILSNPYTAAIDITKLASAFGPNTEATIYIYNTGSFGQWSTNNGEGTNNSTSNIAGQYIAIPQSAAGTGSIPYDIPSMSGFLVKATTAAGSFSMNYNTVMSNINPLRAPVQLKQSTDKVYMEISLKGEHYSDRMWLINQPGTTRGFDNGWDGYKMTGDVGTPQLFAMEESGNYQISTSDDMNNTYLGFQAGIDTQDTLTFNNENIETKYKSIYLFDLVENRIIDITKSGTQYMFMTESTPGPVKRFQIVASPVENETTSAAKLNVFTAGNTVFVQNSGILNGEMIVYDMMGRMLKKAPFAPYGVTAVQVGTIPGAYVVKAATNNESVSKKIIIEKE